MFYFYYNTLVIFLRLCVLYIVLNVRLHGSNILKQLPAIMPFVQFDI